MCILFYHFILLPFTLIIYLKYNYRNKLLTFRELSTFYFIFYFTLMLFYFISILKISHTSPLKHFGCSFNANQRHNDDWFLYDLTLKFLVADRSSCTHWLNYFQLCGELLITHFCETVHTNMFTVTAEHQRLQQLGRWHGIRSVFTMENVTALKTL